VAAIAAVASIGLAELGQALEVLIDQRVHPAFEELDQGLPCAVAIVFSPHSTLRPAWHSSFETQRVDS